MKTQSSLLILGHGYTTRAVAAAGGGLFAHMRATTRSGEKHVSHAGEGMVEPVLYDPAGATQVPAAALDGVTHILVSAPPSADGDPMLAGMGDVIAAMPDLAWIGYLSTTGVYGDHGGAWVDEETPPTPRPGRSAWRLEAENAWQSLAAARGTDAAIFRLSGIYGPGRNAFVSLEAGTARRIDKPGQVFSRIHRDDIARAVIRAMEIGASGIFNLADHEPAPPQDVIEYACGLSGHDLPPVIRFEEAELSPMARSFYEENKRVSNRKAVEQLGFDPAFPDYRAGLDAMWANGSWKG